LRIRLGVHYLRLGRDIIAKKKDEYRLEVGCEVVHFHNRKSALAFYSLRSAQIIKKNKSNSNSRNNNEGLTQVYTHLLTLSWTSLRHKS
jgi:hypothetical protein